MNSLPAAFGDKIRRIDKNYYKYRAHEWKIWNDILFPVLLHDRVPAFHYHNLVCLSEALAIAFQPSISIAEVDKVQTLLDRFMDYYEGCYYKCDWSRLGAMRSVFHHLAHVADHIRQSGPLRIFWQYPMERMVRLLSFWVSSRVATNVNMDNIITRWEQVNHLRYCIDLLSPKLTELDLSFR